MTDTVNTSTARPARTLRVFVSDDSGTILDSFDVEIESAASDLANARRAVYAAADDIRAGIQ